MELLKNDKCDITVIHKDVVERVQKTLLPQKDSNQLAKFFKVFGDSSRIKILHALSHEEMCVCDIAFLLDMSQSAVSHQLRVLKQADIVKYRRDGRVIYYSLDDAHIEAIFNQGYQHITEQS